MPLCNIELVLSRSEKEQRIIEMYEAGCTIREIAKEVHMSFGPIGNIIRKLTGESSKDNNNEDAKSKETVVYPSKKELDPV